MSDEKEDKLDVYSFAKSAKAEDAAQFLDDYCNIGMKDYGNGVIVGKKLQSHHRTIQGSVIRFCLGVIIGLSDVDMRYTDARNETPVAMGQKITQMVKDGDLNMGYMI